MPFSVGDCRRSVHSWDSWRKSEKGTPRVRGIHEDYLPRKILMPSQYRFFCCCCYLEILSRSSIADLNPGFNEKELNRARLL